MNDNFIDVTIGLVTNSPQDAINQNELFYIYEELKSSGANIVPLELDVLPNCRPKAGPDGINILIGAVHIALPASAIISILIAFIKKYFDTLKSKRLQLKNPDGTSIIITGYSEKETEKLLQTLLNSKQCSETNLKELNQNK